MTAGPQASQPRRRRQVRCCLAWDAVSAKHVWKPEGCWRGVASHRAHSTAGYTW